MRRTDWQRRHPITRHGWYVTEDDTNFKAIRMDRYVSGVVWEIEVTDMVDAVGDDANPDEAFICELKRLDMATVSPGQIMQAVESTWGIGNIHAWGDADAPIILPTNMFPVLVPARERDTWTLVTYRDKNYYMNRATSGACMSLATCCLDYGLGAPVDTFSMPDKGSRTIPMLYMQAVRAAASYMTPYAEESEALRRQLDRTVNRIGSTACEYGAGDVWSAMARDTGPDAAIMRKMYAVAGRTLGGEVPPAEVRTLKVRVGYRIPGGTLCTMPGTVTLHEPFPEVDATTMVVWTYPDGVPTSIEAPDYMRGKPVRVVTERMFGNMEHTLVSVEEV